jgi:hypothetical protein
MQKVLVICGRLGAGRLSVVSIQRSVAAYVALMGQQCPKNVGWTGGIDGGQDAANREISAKYAQNYG